MEEMLVYPEELRVGDLVTHTDGEWRPIAWTGGKFPFCHIDERYTFRIEHPEGLSIDREHSDYLTIHPKTLVVVRRV